MNLQPCIGCGALVPEIEVPAHRYAGASPGCWAAFGEVSEKGYGDFRYARVHGLTVDAYCAQHPWETSPQAIRSVAVHLIALHLQLERGSHPKKLYAARQSAASLAKEGKKDFAWLEPPASPGWLTVLHVHDARDPDEHVRRVREWARSVWEAWSPHHATVRRWAEP